MWDFGPSRLYNRKPSEPNVNWDSRVSAKQSFIDFTEQFTQVLQKQTGLTLGAYAAMLLSGQSPSHPSAVGKFAKKCAKKRAKGKTLSDADVDQLLEMVTEYMEHQAIPGTQRVSFGRTVLTKIIPSLTSTDLDNTNASSVADLKIDDATRAAIQEWLEDEL